MPALLTSSGRPGFYFRVLEEGEVGAGDEIVKVGEAKERMTVAEINALLYLPEHTHDRLERALGIEALSPGWRASFEALLRGRPSGNAGLMPEAAAHPAAPGFRQLAVTAIDRESADVLSLTMHSPDRRPLPMALPGQYVVLRLLAATDGPPLFRSYSLSGPVSTESYRISVKIEPNGAPEPGCVSMSGWAMRSMLVRRGEASFLRTANGQWCCSARALERRQFWRCYMHWRGRARLDLSCGCTQLGTGRIIPLRRKSAA